ncbi:MAG: bifunctional phosphopantothenoylcysteine decarboxylase/phosphopantothenate--cysteine ligase CoaBC, partial [Candidatus Marinimicrobia bacterium]|nr:bifunctional phosphopantothenoylcysteine decarboxylase/phosphopantothenate--cysteine ligase CoaBC [Candidatus Neomarinimicrobiota bacterium]
MLKGKTIVLGITGGIAAYKSAELTREFIKQGADVKVVMTENATKFITSLTLQTLSGNPVYTDTFSLIGNGEIQHISLAETADIVVIAPATANIIGKIASGIADDLLSTFIMATRAPVLIYPAMNTNMYTNNIVRANMEKLSSAGYIIMDADYGELACKAEGAGRLPPAERIIEEAVSVLTKKDLTGEKILITAGPTREPFDPVRFISNYSSGKMGYAFAIMARRRGADVVLISGPTSLPVPAGIKFVGTSTAVEMRDAVMENLEGSTVVIKVAAVADYRPSVFSDSKIKKEDGPFSISLEKNPDIISEVGKIKGDRILVGFAMETENLLQNAYDKMISKNMDLIVANDLSRSGAGFQYDTNSVRIIDSSGDVRKLPIMDKKKVADRILDRIKKMRE